MTLLSELIKDIKTIKIDNDFTAEKMEIQGLTADSRKVEPGFIFAALSGEKTDGGKFIMDAIEKGATAIIASKSDKSFKEGMPLQVDLSKIVVIETENPRLVFAQITAKFYSYQPEFIVAITGSNGKTSTAHFTRQIWQRMNRTAASLGTIGVDAPGIINKAGSLTTPDPVTLHNELKELEASGVTHIALEASSHGLDQYRLDGVKIKAAGFSNLTRDHMDYHKTMENYKLAKQRLFSEILENDGVAILNADVPEFKEFKQICDDNGKKVLSYGYKGLDINIVKREALPSGQYVELKVLGELYKMEIPLIGEFQLYNALCALGLVLSEKLENPAHHMESVTALEKLQTVRGRLEYAGSKNGAAIYVDYAHTPDGLVNVLKALRPHTKGKLHTIIGCGGDRDKGKRPEMGKAANDLADVIIVTDDNPRSEDPAKIRKSALKACPKGIEVADRKKAIIHAVNELKKGDILVITGKGHEQGQIIGNEIIPFDDVEEVKKAI